MARRTRKKELDKDEALVKHNVGDSQGPRARDRESCKPIRDQRPQIPLQEMEGDTYNRDSKDWSEAKVAGKGHAYKRMGRGS